LQATIRDNLIVESKLSIDMFEEKFGYSLQGDHFQAWSDNYPLHKTMVDHDHDRVKTPRGRVIGDQINGKEGKGNSCRGGNGDKRGSHRMGVRFHLLTEGTSFNIFLDIGTKTGPPVIALDKFFHFEMAGVTHHGVIMEVPEKVMVCGGGDIGTILIIQDGIDNFPIRQCRFHGW